MLLTAFIAFMVGLVFTYSVVAVVLYWKRGVSIFKSIRLRWLFPMGGLVILGFGLIAASDPGSRMALPSGEVGEVVTSLQTTERSVVAIDGENTLRIVANSDLRPEPTATPTPEPTPTPTPDPFADWPYRAYLDSSPWNTPIPDGAAVRSNSVAMVATLGSPLTSDPTQYSYPRYVVDSSTPTFKVNLSGVYSNVTSDTTPFQFVTGGNGDPTIPIPTDAAPVPGSDGQVIIIDPATGDEWGFWQFAGTPSAGYKATNGYHYNLHWSAYPPRSTGGGPFGSQGAGIPYTAGVVHPEEVKAGEIRHAINLAALAPSAAYVYPAAKSDGTSSNANAAPEGQRFQLDPGRTDAELEAVGCRNACLVIARALQRYGAYVTDRSGRTKLRIQAQQTAGWGTGNVPTVTASTVSPIPMTWFRALVPEGS